MTKHQFLRGLKAGTAPVVMGLALVSLPAYAQTTDGTAAADQQTPAANPTDTATPASGGDIVVTGSRIPQPNLTSASPVTVVNSQEFKLTGTTRVEDLLNALPQVFADQGGQVSNAATGTSTVNLRNLGANRTLVLIDGRRLVPGDPTDSSADLNFIPSSLIKRVDVLTGGASSTYGADAVGGVVNFIMDTDFTGFRLDGQYSFYQHQNDASSAVHDALNAKNFGYPDGSVADGGTVDTTATIGAGFDDNRGHVVAYVGYRRINAILQSRRDYSACSLQATKAGVVSCGGSATSPNGTIISYAGGALGDVDKNGDPAPYGNGTSTYFQVAPGRGIEPGFTPYNYGPTNYYQRPDERYTAGFFAHYDVDDHFKPYIQGMFMDDRSVAQIAASGDFGNTYAVNCNNPLLGAAQQAVICDAGNLIAPTVNRDPDTGVYSTSPPAYSDTIPVSSVTSNYQNYYGVAGVPANAFNPYNFVDPLTGTTYTKGFAQILKRNVEGGPRQDDLQHTAYRLVVGAKGDINDAFTYDAYYQYGRTNYAETYRNDVSVTRLGRALDVVTDPSTGNPVCRSVLDGTDPNCVPYDIFSGNVSQAAVQYLSTPGFKRGQVSEQVASLNVTGLLGKYGIQSPWASEGVGINIGTEYRREALNLDTDLEFQTGDLAGQGAPTLPIKGAFNVYEAYGEVRVPVVHDNFVYDLSFDGGYRRSQYELEGRSYGTDTYKIGADFAPIRQIRFRGAYNRAVRSPNIQELYATQIVALDGSTDPCSDRVITAADTGCLAQGLKVGQKVASNPAGQYNGLIGGNPDLTPEVADTYTAGVVLQPDFISALQGLAITVDYFNIKVKNTVSTIGPDTILAECGKNPTSSFCGLIHRDSTGSLWRSSAGYVVDTTQNLGSLKTSGIDVGGTYAHSLGSLGSFSVTFNGTYLHNFTTNNGVSTPYNCAGYYGSQCGTPAPKWRHKLRVGFTLPDGIGLSAAWRYFGSVDIDASSSNPTLNPINPATGLPSNNYSAFAQHIKAQSYFDLAATAAIGEHYTFRLGVQNLLDKDPPLVSGAGTYACPAGFCNGNTYPVVYDALGRYIYTGISLNF